MPFEPAVAPPSPPSPDALWFVVARDGVLVRRVDDRLEIPCVSEPASLGLPAADAHFLGRLDGTDCFGAPAPEGFAPPEGHAFKGLRSLFAACGETLFGIAGRAVQVVAWDETHRFCGRCGAATTRASDERSRKCPACALSAYPRIAPAIIVLVRRGEEALLARGSRFPMPMYSTLAGFVEPGESLEETVAREVREEVGIEVADVRYFGSQPWPFPHSLMVGFTATWAGGELKVDGAEILDAQWYPRDALPMMPPKPSIARRLIDAWLEEPKAAPA
jgi:NAD+ diphosphatase